MVEKDSSVIVCVKNLESHSSTDAAYKENHLPGTSGNEAGKVELSEEQLQLRKWAGANFNFIVTSIKSFLF